MELLLVIAIVAVVAAIAIPTFYMNAGERINQARLSMFKARYTAIRAAIDLQLKDEAVLDPQYHVAGINPSVSRIKRLVASGHLQPGSLSYENKLGEQILFSIDNAAIATDLPPVLQTSNLCVFAQSHNIDRYLKVDNKTWQQIWEDIN